MKKFLSATAVAAMFALVAGTASAALVSSSSSGSSSWNFDYQGGPVSAMGSFQVGTGDLITSITGVYTDSYVTGAAITGLVALGTDGAWTYDQKFNNFASMVFTNAGLLFSVVGLPSSVNVYSEGGKYINGTNVGNVYALQEVKWNVTQDGTTPAVPEPKTYAVLLAGLAGIGGLVSRRRVTNHA